MLRQITYQGVFEPAEGNAFSVYFPDLPGCTSYGETLGDAQKNAQDALGLPMVWSRMATRFLAHLWFLKSTRKRQKVIWSARSQFSPV